MSFSVVKINIYHLMWNREMAASICSAGLSEHFSQIMLPFSSLKLIGFLYFVFRFWFLDDFNIFICFIWILCDLLQSWMKIWQGILFEFKLSFLREIKLISWNLSISNLKKIGVSFIIDQSLDISSSWRL